MFRLLRYFSLTSALVIAVVTVVMVLFYRQGAVSDLIASAETHNVSLARSFANTIWPDVSGYVTTVDEDGDGLRQRPETARLHDILRTLTDGLPVLKIKIYNLDGLTVYSSQASQMGEDKSGNAGFLMARDDSMPASKLSSRDSFSAFSGAVENRDLVETYVAVHGEDGSVEGVLEIYTDVTPLKERLDRNTASYMALFLLIFAVLYGALFVIVRRADGILNKQYLELEENEKNIQAKNAELKGEIAEREQAEAELRSAKEAAETANRAKSEFLAIVSHEVRTPMNGVLGMAGMLLDSELGQEQWDYARTIKKSGEGLMTIIDDILDFSKAEAGKLTLEELDFGLVPLVDNVLELLGPEAGGKGIDLAGYLAPGIPKELRGDDGRIRQVLLNLIGNAVKFTKSGGVTLDVTAEGEPSVAGGVTLRFVVTDTGDGIPTGALEKIFGAFAQADSSTTRRFGGTGLGLAISERLVTLMGGEIGVESEVGQGSRFWFTVPLKNSSRLAGDWTNELAEPLRGRRVLVVAGAERVRAAFEKQLAAFELDVSCAAEVESGRSCLREAAHAKAPFDIVILDELAMPANSNAAVADIREDAGRKAVSLILSSSTGRIDSDMTSQDIGYDEALPRPVRPGQLLRCLNGLLDAKPVVDLKAAKASAKQPPAPGKVFRILLAEDNSANRKVVIALLSGCGYRIDTVANGLEAVEAMQNRPYDLVLMDIEMPELDGPGAARQIRRLPGKIGAVPIIAVTAHVMEGDREACKAAGMNDFIAKPIDRPKLVEKIGFWLGRTASPQTEIRKLKKA